MGADKALLLLGGESAVERVVRICRAGGVAGVTVVRSRGAAPLPDGLAAHIDLDALRLAGMLREIPP